MNAARRCALHFYFFVTQKCALRLIYLDKQKSDFFVVVVVVLPFECVCVHTLFDCNLIEMHTARVFVSTM